MPVLACQPVRRARSMSRCSRSRIRAALGVVEVAARCPRQHPLEEEDLARPERAHPGEHPLVEQEVADEDRRMP